MYLSSAINDLHDFAEKIERTIGEIGVKHEIELFEINIKAWAEQITKDYEFKINRVEQRYEGIIGALRLELTKAQDDIIFIEQKLGFPISGNAHASLPLTDSEQPDLIANQNQEAANSTLP